MRMCIFWIHLREPGRIAEPDHRESSDDGNCGSIAEGSVWRITTYPIFRRHF